MLTGLHGIDIITPRDIYRWPRSRPKLLWTC